MSFWGHVLNENAIRPDDALIEKVKATKLTKNRKEQEKFLGLTQFYGRLVTNFAEICNALSDQRVLNTKFKLTEVAAKAFEEEI